MGDKYVTDNKFANNIKFVTYVVIINTLMYFLSILFTSHIWTDFVTWFSKNLGDVPTWVLAIATPISILIGFLIAKKQLKLNLVQLTQSAEQQKQEAKIEEQKFFFEIDRIFSRSDSEEVRDIINNEIYLKQNIDMTNSDIKKKIDNYLNHLEFICNMYQEKIVSKKMIDAFVGGRISNALKCTSINEYITSERIRIEEPRLWEALEQVNLDLRSNPQN